MIKEYAKKDGSKAFMFSAYLGVDPITGKQLRTTRRGFKTKKEASLAKSRLLLDVEENGFVGMNKKITFRELFELWKIQYENTVKESTFRVQLDAIRLHVLPYFSDLPIDKITLTYCQKQINHWYSYYTNYPNLIGLTQRILDYAISLEVLSDNPMKKAIRPKRRKKVDESSYIAEYYDKDELQHFFECVKKENELQTLLLFRLLSFSGIRKSELLALRWSDINTKASTLSVNQTLAKGLNNKYIFQTPKTEKSIRTISIDPITLSLIQKWRIYQKKQLLSFGVPSINNNEMIFTDLEGDIYDMDHPNRLLNKLIAKYDLKKITVHGFRHTHCSLLFESGASIKEVQDRLGHTDIQTTMNIYTHVTEKAKEETAQKFASYVNF